MAVFKNGKIVISKVNESGETIETLCVELERNTRKEQKIVLYPLLDANNKYIFEHIDVAIKAGLKKEYIEQEIKKYIANKDNYDYKEEMRKKEIRKSKHNPKDLLDIMIFAATTLEELAEIYWELERRNLLVQYKNKILSRVNEVNIDDPFFYVEFSKYQYEWGDDENNHCFILYMTKINLLLEKYRDIKYDEMLNFNGVQVKKGHYLEELLCYFMEQWLSYSLSYSLNQQDFDKFCTIYSKFEYARYSSYAMAILHLSFANCIDNINSKSIKEIILMYDKKVKNKLDEIRIPSLSFEHSYVQALETNNCIYYAKAFLQATNNEEMQKLKLLEEKIKTSFFNIEDCLLLQLSFLEKHDTTRNWETNIIALVTLLDNVNLKNTSNFKRLHLLFYQYFSYYNDWCLDSKSSRVILKIKELYDNNCYKYDEEVEREYKFIMR